MGHAVAEMAAMKAKALRSQQQHTVGLSAREIGEQELCKRLELCCGRGGRRHGRCGGGDGNEQHGRKEHAMCGEKGCCNWDGLNSQGNCLDC